MGEASYQVGKEFQATDTENFEKIERNKFGVVQLKREQNEFGVVRQKREWNEFGVMRQKGEQNKFGVV